MRTRLTSGFPQERSQIAKVRPRVRSVQLLLYLPERVADPHVARALATGSDRSLHVISLTRPEQVDDQLGQWLELSYDFDNLSVSPAECPPPSAALAFLTGTNLDMDGRSEEAELLSQLPLDEPEIAGLDLTRSEQHEGGRSCLNLSPEQNSRLLAATDRMWMGSDDAAEEGVQLARRDP